MRLRRKLGRMTALMLSWSLVLGLFAPTMNALSDDSRNADYWNPELSVEERVQDLLGRMTLDEKLGQMIQASRVGANNAILPASEVAGYFLGSVLSGGGANPTPNTPQAWASMIASYRNAALETRLGIPIMYGVDAVHGHNNVVGATIFPHNIGLGAAGLGLRGTGDGDQWSASRDLMRAIGSTVAQEVRATGIDWTFAPTLAVPLDIRWGRTYEGFGQSPELAGALGAALVEGFQGEVDSADFLGQDRVVATIKHWVGDGATTRGVDQGNVEMTEEELRVYMQPYVEALQAGARTVMVTLSGWNGLKSHADERLVTRILKEEYGFDGIVISDWNAITNTASYQGWTFKRAVEETVNAGVDMFMLQEWKTFITTAKELLSEGAIDISRIDDAVSRILRVKFESGLFEHPAAAPTAEQLASVGSAEHRAIAREAVSKSLVLLKNEAVGGEGKRVLPLDKQAKILVAGDHANNIGLQSGGWTISWQGGSGATTTGTTILQGLRKVAPDAEIVYNREGFDYDMGSFDAAIVVVGEQPYAEMFGDNLGGLQLTRDQQMTIHRAAESGIPTVLVAISGRPIVVESQIGQVGAFVAAWLPGTEGDGIAEVLFGDKDFTGKLPADWPWYAEQIPMHPADRGGHEPLFAYGAGGSYARPEQLPVIGPKPAKPEPAYVPILAEGAARIEAENFTAFSGVQTETTSDVGGGLNVGWTDPGRWMEYRLDVGQSGVYDVRFRVAGGQNPAVPGNIRWQSAIGNGTRTTVVDVPYTGGWQNWQTITAQVVLQEGEQTLRITSGAPGWNINWFELEWNRAATAEELEPDAVVNPTELPPLQQDAVRVWYSSEKDPSDFKWYMETAEKAAAIPYKLDEQPSLPLTAVGGSPMTTINLNPGAEYQTFLGLGTSMEEATVANLVKMSAGKREEVLRKLVASGDGEAGMSLIRITLGTSDFTGQRFYSYNDMPPGETDPNLEHFSIRKDIDLGIVDTLKQLLAINPDLKLFASPWSPPGWMKTTGSMIRGQLLEQYVPTAALYYRKALEAYAEQGVPIYAMTLQNEPELEIDYPSMRMTPDQQRRFAIALRAELDKSDIESVRNTKLWAFDHNFSGAMNYMNPILSNPEGYAAIDGIAFHDYSGSPAEMTTMHNAYPSKEVALTERSVWGTVGADRIVQYLRNYAISYNSWVTMLNTAIMPEQWTGIPDPTLLIQNAWNPDEYWALPEFYITGQFSKFIQPGAKRIESNYGSSATVTNVAFLNPDNTIAMVVVNQSSQDQWFKTVADSKQFQAKIPAKTVATYVWERAKAPAELPGTLQAESFTAKSAGTDIVTSPDDNVVYIGGLETGAWLEYEVTVPEAGEYRVQYRIATHHQNGGNGNNKKFKLSAVNLAEPDDILQLGEGMTLPHTTWGWENWVTAQETLQLHAGTYKLRLDIEQGQFNLDWIRFAKAPGAIAVPGKVDAAQYAQGYIATVEDRGNVGHTAEGTWLEYNVTAAEAGEYPITLRYATTQTTASAVIASEDSETVTIPLAATGGWDSYSNIASSGTLALRAGEQTVRLLMNGANFNLDWLSIGNGIMATAPEPIGEGREAGQMVTLEVIGGAIGEGGLKIVDIALSGAPAGVTVDRESIALNENGTLISFALEGNRLQDYDTDREVGVVLTVADHGDGGRVFSLQDSVTFIAVDDSESLAAAWNADYSGLLLTLEGGSFDPEHLADIALSGPGAAYATVTGATYSQDDWSQAVLSLNWADMHNVREHLGLTVTVPTTAYDDSTGGAALTAELVREADTSAVPYRTVPARIEAESYSLMSGVTSPTAGAEGTVVELTGGDWAEYKLNVPTSGNYIFSYRLNSQNGASQGLQLSIDGTEIGTRNVIQLWSSWVIMKEIVALEAGEQTLRIRNAGSGTYRLNWFDIDTIPQAIAIPGKIEAEQTYQLTGGVTQDGTGTEKHLGFLAAGDVLKYEVHVADSGIYKVTYRAATQQSTAEIGIRAGAGPLLLTPFASTGGWTSWATVSAEIELSAGEQTIEIHVVGDGYNFDWMEFEFEREVEPEPTPSPTTDPGTEPTPSPTTDPGTEPTPSPTTDPGTEPTLSPTTDPGTQPTPSPTTNPGTQPTPSPTPTPTAGPGTGGSADSDRVRTITESDLQATDDGVLRLTLSGAQTSLSIPISLLDGIEADGMQAVSGDGIRIEIPVSVLQSLAAANGGDAQAGQIIVRLEPAAGQTQGSLKLVGKVYDIELILRTNGKDTRLTDFDEPVRVVFPIDPNMAAKELLGVYYYNEAVSGWEYVGGTVYEDHVAVMLSHFSRYALMTYDKTFADVPPTHWAHGILKVLAAKHIVNGVAEDRFAPNGTTSRAQFTALLVRALGLKTGNAEAVPFDDVAAGAWYAKDIAAAYEAGLVQGVSDRSFAPDAHITREQMALLIVRAYEFAQGQPSGDGRPLQSCADAEAVSGWAKDGVSKAVALGLMRGKSADRFDPAANAIRSETAQVIYNLLQKL